MAKGRKTGGRIRGTPNKGTVEARQLCASIIDDPVYQERLTRRALAGELPPAIEALLWHYAKGKPREQLDVTVNAALEESKARLRRALQRLQSNDV